MNDAAPVRYLCSQLVTLAWEEGATIVNLEEIQESGCVVESEAELGAGVEVELHCGGADFKGKVTKAEVHGFGWRIAIEFSPATRWKLGDFRPEHLFDPASLLYPASMKPQTT